MPSIYYPELNHLSAHVVLDGEEYHHLTRVTRARTGDEILLNSGSGIMARARILGIDKLTARLEVLSLQTNLAFPAPFAIAFALLKNRHDELLVEKCTELGAGQFFPLISQYTVRKASSESKGRFERIVLAAIKQCDNPILPVFTEPQSPAKALQSVIESGYTPILCSELKPDQWLKDLALQPEAKPCFFIGPEGGWSMQEIRLFAEANIPQVSIGHLVMRAETAAITIAAQWLAQAKKPSTQGTT